MKLYGPQVDRERSSRVGSSLNLSTRSLNVSQSQSQSQSQSRPLQVDRNLEADTVEAEVSRLQRENAMLTEQLQRSLLVLQRYQLKYPSAYIEIQENEVDDYDLPPWNQSADAFLPLFNAYDARIRELEDIVNLKTQELARFQSTLDTVTAENEQLRDLQISQIQLSSTQNHYPSTAASSSKFDSIHSVRLFGGNQKEFDTQNILNNELIAELNERIEILMTENGLLTEQKLALSNELERYHNDLQINSQELKSFTGQFHLLKRENQNLKVTMNQIELDRDEAAKQALAYSEALSKLDATQASLRDQITILTAREQEYQKIISHLKKELQDIKKAAEEESYDSMRGVKILEDRLRELQTTLIEKTNENDSAQETIRKLKREYQSTRQDAEGMLQVMSGLEKKLSEYTSREAEVEILANESKVKVAEAISLRNQAIRKEKLLEQEVTRLIEENKQITRDKFIAIEREAANIHQKATEQIQTAEKEMQNMAEVIASLRLESETAIRESRSALEHIDRLKRLHQDDSHSYEESLRLLQLKLNDITIAKEEEYQKRSEIQETNKDLRLIIDKLRIQVDTLKSQFYQSDRLRKTEQLTYKSSLHDLQKEIVEKTKELEKSYQTIDSLEQSMQLQSFSTESKINEEISSYRQRAMEAEKILREFEENNLSIDTRSKYLIDKLKESTNYSIDQLNSLVDKEKEKSRVLAAKIEEKEDTLASIMEERDQLLIVIDEAKATIQKLQEESQEANRKVSDLTNELITSTTADVRDISHYQRDDDIEEDRYLEKQQISETYHYPITSTNRTGIPSFSEIKAEREDYQDDDIDDDENV